MPVRSGPASASTWLRSARRTATCDSISAGCGWVCRCSRPRSIPIRARLAVNTAEAALDAALAGVGLTQVLSYQAANAVKDKRLKIVLKEFELEPLPVHLVHPAQALPPLKLRRFLEFALPRLKQALAEIDRRVG